MTKMARGASKMSFIVSSRTDNSTTYLLLYLVSHRIDLQVDSSTENPINHQRNRDDNGHAHCVLCQLRPLLVLKEVLYLFHQTTPFEKTIKHLQLRQLLRS